MTVEMGVWVRIDRKVWSITTRHFIVRGKIHSFIHVELYCGVSRHRSSCALSRMQGIKDFTQHKLAKPAIAIGNRNLSLLQKGAKWTGPRGASERAEALQERLEELLIFELRDDGGNEYLQLSVRGLYRYVLAAITNKAKAEEIRAMPNVSTDVTTAISDTMKAPVPLGRAISDESSLPPMPKPVRKKSRGKSLGNIPEDQIPAPKGTEGVTYRERLGGYLHPRDMRRLVTPFSASNEPELIVRRHVMLLNFDPIRAIILRDRLLVIVPDGADSLLVNLEQRVRGGSVEVEASIFGDEDTPPEKDKYETSHSTTLKKKKKSSLLQKIIRKSSDAVSRLNAEAEDERNNSGDEESRTMEATFNNTDSGDEMESELDPVGEDFNHEDEDDNDEDEWQEMEGREWIDLPFELQCADACLHLVGGLLTEDTHELQEATLNYIQRIVKGDNTGDDSLSIIRAVKDAVREMSSRVKGFVQSMNRILDEDEDMALMNLSRLLTHPERFIQPVPQEVLEEESDEPELILEAHLQTALTLMNSLDLIKGQIDTASELLDQRLDSIRNKILLANVFVSILSLCAASISVVGSIFGMNLRNHIEQDPRAFIQVTFGSIAGAVVLGLAIIYTLVRAGAIQILARDPGLH